MFKTDFFSSFLLWFRVSLEVWLVTKEKARGRKKYAHHNHRHHQLSFRGEL